MRKKGLFLTPSSNSSYSSSFHSSPFSSSFSSFSSYAAAGDRQSGEAATPCLVIGGGCGGGGAGGAAAGKGGEGQGRREKCYEWPNSQKPVFPAVCHNFQEEIKLGGNIQV